VSINEDGASPDNSAILDISDTARGVLVPRMSQIQRDAISNPATGLLIFQTNNDSGFYFNLGVPATPNWLKLQSSLDNAQWSTKDTNVFYSRGNVGIGTNSPSVPLQIQGKTSGKLRLSTSLNASSFDLGLDQNQNLLFEASGNDYFLMQQGGRMTIGSDSASPFPLFITNPSGGSSFYRNYTTAGQAGLWFTNDSSSWAIFSEQQGGTLLEQGAIGLFSATGLGAAWTVLDDGQMGIGTINPEQRLHIQRSDDNTILLIDNPTGTFESRLEFRKFGSFTAGIGFYPGNPNLRFRTSSGDITFEPDTAEVMRVTTAGNVGIGTTTPALQLSVGPADDDTGFETNADGVLDVFTNGTKKMEVGADGQVLIGTVSSSNAVLTLADDGGDLNSGLQLSTSTGDDWYMYQNPSFELVFRDDGIDRFKVTTAGSLVPASDNVYDLGSASLRWDDLYATNGSILTSDIRFKTNITPLQYGLKEVLSINPIRFEWKDKKDGQEKIGLSAQELMEVIPEIVKTHERVKDEQGEWMQKELEKYGVYYTDLIPVLINAIKEQQQLIDTQLQNNEKQQYELDELRDEINHLRNKLK